MTPLWLGIALLTLGAVAIVFLPALRAQRLSKESAADRKALNVAIYQERVAELEDELNSGNLDQSDFEALKIELEKNLLQDVADEGEAVVHAPQAKQSKVIAMVLSLVVVVMALAIYGKYGHMADLELAMNQPSVEQSEQGEMPTVEEAIAQLEQRLAQQPENPEGWYMLANTYMSMEQFSQAADGFANVLKYLPEDTPQYSGVAGQYAQALFFARDGKMDEQIRAAIDRALALEPLEITALGLLGIDAFEKGNYRDAIEYWSKALPNADGQAAESLRTGISSARERLVAAGEEVSDLPEVKSVELRLAVSLDSELLEKADPQQRVFIFARPIGGRMPLAAVSMTVADLPTHVVLNDSMAMSPQAKLSSADQVEVIARISTSGEPKPQPGDLMGVISPVAVQDQIDILDLSIDQIVE